MSGEDLSSYAPKSPDLSSFFPSGPTQQQPAPAALSLDDSYTPPGSTFRQQPPGQQYQPPRPHHGAPYQEPQPHNHSASSSYIPSQGRVKSEYPPPVSPHTAPPVPAQHQPYPPPNPHHLAPESAHHQYQGYPPAPYSQPYSFPDRPQYPPAPGAPGGVYPPHDIHAQPLIAPQQPGSEMPTRRAAAAAAAAAASSQMADEPPASPPAAQAQAPAPAPTAPVIEPSPVRTKFPTARIKRIMQADEEVGKVAQQTPIAVGKALEMFMVQLVTKSAEVAKDKGSKRVTAPMLKQVVEGDDQWDFLRDIVGKVENEKEGSKSKLKAESESDEDSFEPKKKGRGGRKKKTG